MGRRQVAAAAEQLEHERRRPGPSRPRPQVEEDAVGVAVPRDQVKRHAARMERLGPIEDRLHGGPGLPGRQGGGGQTAGPSDVDEVAHVTALDALGLHEVEDGLEVGEGRAREREAEPDREPRVPAVPEATERLLVGPREPPEPVVEPRCRDRHPDVGRAGLAEIPRRTGVDQRPVRRDRRVDPEPDGPADQLEQVGPEEGVAARENQGGHPAAPQLVDEGATLLQGELLGVGRAPRARVAVLAVEVAAPGEVQTTTGRLTSEPVSGAGPGASADASRHLLGATQELADVQHV
jgi:hypothetical protein